MSYVIKTIADIDPSQIHLMDKEYDVLKQSYKHKQEDGSFYLTDSSFEGRLAVLDVIKRQSKHIRDKENAFLFEDTGRFLITPEGERYLEYRHNESKKDFKKNIKWWATTLIAILALLLSIWSLSLDYLYQKNLKQNEKQEKSIAEIDKNSVIK